MPKYVFYTGKQSANPSFFSLEYKPPTPSHPSVYKPSTPTGFYGVLLKTSNSNNLTGVILPGLLDCVNGPRNKRIHFLCEIETHQHHYNSEVLAY